jgi:hypothetical protein
VKKVLFSVLCVLFLESCATTYRDRMMDDGNTWKIAVSDLNSCNGFSSTDSCVRALKPMIDARATQACSAPPFRIFECGKTTLNARVALACRVHCKDPTQIQIKIKETEQNTVVDKDLLTKAKKCQDKGGVWVNNSCQISLE